jgi:hypothetical protein
MDEYVVYSIHDFADEYLIYALIDLQNPVK